MTSRFASLLIPNMSLRNAKYPRCVMQRDARITQSPAEITFIEREICHRFWVRGAKKSEIPRNRWRNSIIQPLSKQSSWIMRVPFNLRDFVFKGRNSTLRLQFRDRNLSTSIARLEIEKSDKLPYQEWRMYPTSFHSWRGKKKAGCPSVTN